jgi:DNA polymerase III delta subunit
MPYLLLGSDTYSKNQFVKHLTKQSEAQVAVFTADDKLPTADELSQTDLFSKAKVFIFQGVIPEYFSNLTNQTHQKNPVIVSIESLDKRKKENKDLLTNKNIEVKEFILPHGNELNSWIQNRVGELGGKISPQAINELAVRVGRDSGKETKVGGKVIAVEEAYNLFMVDSEIEKLMSFTSKQEISVEVVKELVVENGEVDVFDLTNAIADNNSTRAMELMHKFLKEQTGSDEKGSVIQLNALLGEQFRNVAMLQDFIKNKISDDEILERTSWKPGRLFVLKKISLKFEIKKILDLLNKLEALDQELKTSQVPPKVILDLIITQLLFN